MIVPSACMGSPTVPISVQCSTRKKYRAQQPAIPGPPLAGTVSDPAREARPRLLVQARATLTYGCRRHELASWPVIRPAGQLRRQDRDMRTPPRRFRGAQPNRDKTACVHKRGRAHTCHLSPTSSSPLKLESWAASPAAAHPTGPPPLGMARRRGGALGSLPPLPSASQVNTHQHVSHPACVL